VTPTRRVSIGIKTSPQAVDWSTLDAAWARIGEHDVFDSVWMNDHLTDVSQERHGASLEALTAMAALVHRVPAKWVGHAVLSATFRHPAVLAKAATVMDHATGGRFIVGLGAGWHEGEHIPFGIPMPPMPERFDRFESAVHVLRALWSDEASRPPGVTRPDPFFPLSEATNEPPPLTRGGPPLWLGGQKRRGIALAAAVADGWPLPAVVALGSPSDLDYFSRQYDAIVAALDAIGRDPTTFEFSAQIPTGETADDHRWALDQARDAARRGATHVILGMPPRLGPLGVDAVARNVAEPLREALG
jgi:alkanesulfonate monooxygenase SsuD/methylene tetrahydromethanopterin reductase-like flavin-dependent oxidoreductase (luciferase family)